MAGSALADVASSLGLWVAHVSGTTSLSTLDTHRRGFGLDPVQTLVKAFRSMATWSGR